MFHIYLQRNYVKLSKESYIMTIKKPIKELIINVLNEHKALDVVSFDIKVTSLADNVVIATGTSNRHIRALSEHLLILLKETGVKNILIEGLEDCNWVLIDIGDEVIHILSNEMRSFYNLEGIFQNISQKQSYA